MVTAGYWDGTTDTNWDDVLTDEGNVQQDFSLSARGGNANTSFYLSGSFFEQEGIIIGTGLDRYSSKFDIRHQFDERVNVQNSLNLSFVEQDGVLEGSGYFGNPALARNFLMPMQDPYNEDGSPAIFGGLHNPVYIQENSIDRKRNARLINSTNINVQLAPSLNLQTRFGVDYLLSKEKYYDDRYHGDGDDDLGRVYDYVNNNSRITLLTNLTHVFSINDKNTLTSSLFMNLQKNWFYSLQAGGLGFAADGLYNLTSTASPDFVSGFTTDYGTQSFTTTFNYNYSDKLYADFNAVYEGNSRFADDERFGLFLSGGVAYVLSNEKYMEDVDFVDYLRVKLSAGQTGNAGVGVNQYQAFVSFGAYNDQPSINLGQLGNQALSWEKAFSIDAKVDFELINRISGSFTYYRKNSSDLLFNVPLSRTTGHSSQEQNIGKLFNDGIEVELSADIIRNRDFRFNLSANMTTVRNQVTELPVDGNGEEIEISSSLYYTAVEGYEVNSFYTREWAGVDPNNGDPLWFITDENGNRTTTNSYGSATLYPFKKNADPDLFGSFIADVAFKGLYASATLYYAFDYLVYDDWAGYQLRDGSLLGIYNYYAKSLERWQKPGDITDVPRLGASALNSFRTSSRNLYDGDHLRLKELRVGYDIPTSLTEAVGVSRASVYLSGTNLWTHVFDEDLEFDPDAFGPNGQQDLAIPPLKSYVFGLKIDF
jgi:TonB-linked SusC/RagA family outer membrane protein